MEYFFNYIQNFNNETDDALATNSNFSFSIYLQPNGANL